MARRKLISDQEILKAKLEIKNGKSLRETARNLGIHPSSLSDRLHKINNQLTITELTKPDTKPDTLKVKSILKPDIKPIIPDTKPDTRELYLSSDALRGLFQLFYGKSDGHNNSRVKLLDIFIDEFERQKGIVR